MINIIISALYCQQAPNRVFFTFKFQFFLFKKGFVDEIKTFSQTHL